MGTHQTKTFHLSAFPYRLSTTAMNGTHSFEARTPVPPDNMSRMPQYNAANESAAEKGQASSETNISQVPRPPTANVAPSTAATTALGPSTEADDTIGAGWEDLGSEPSARPAPFNSGNDVSTRDISGPAGLVSGIAAGAVAGFELSSMNMRIHDLMNNPEPIPRWLFVQEESNVQSSTIYLEPGSSKSPTTVLGETIAPVAAESVQATEFYGIGDWADNPRSAEY